MQKHKGFSKSMRLYEEALKYIPAGVSSNARLWENPFVCSFAACTVFIEKAKGSHIWDVDKNEYIDYRLAFGPVILGHSYPAVHRAVHKVDEKGTVYGLDNELEIRLAKLLSKIVPNAEMMRFANSGTEATMHSLRIARAYTKKEKIIKFEGHYHGAHDYLLFSTQHLPFKQKIGVPNPQSLGIPKTISSLIITEQWNDFERIEKAVKLNHKEVAAIITEPVMGNAAAIPPRPGYLKHLKELCEKYDLLLIFDEVKTGFRLAMGGAQEKFRVKPHMAAFSKSMGNGYPIAAVTGLRDIMQIVGPGSGRVVHGGTFAGNPVSMAASIATIEELKKRKVFKYINSYGGKVMKGLRDIFERNRINAIVHGYPGMFMFIPTKKRKIENYRDLQTCDANFCGRLQYELLLRGVMIDEDFEEPMYTCFSHSRRDLNKTLAAFEEAIKAAKIPRSFVKKTRFRV